MDKLTIHLWEQGYDPIDIFEETGMPLESIEEIVANYELLMEDGDDEMEEIENFLGFDPYDLEYDRYPNEP